MEAIEPA